jgi:signal transduction histidine kinase/CheY-like chemotaxis protein/HAMP domain-containing protein
MKLKDLKIGTQLKIGFGIMLLLVIVLGIISYHQTDKIHKQTELISEHSLKSRITVGEIRTSINQLHWAMETAMSFDDYEFMEPFVKIMEENDSKIQKNMDILEEAFLGPHEFIDNLRIAVSGCKKNRDLVFHLIQAGNWQQAERINIHKGTVLGSEHMNELHNLIEKISRFAFQKANELQVHSQRLKNILAMQLLLVIFAMVIFALYINHLLLRNIRFPLSELTGTTRRFYQGDMSARSNYSSKSEIGILAESFNNLAENIEVNADINEKSAMLTSKMLSEDDAKKFFQSTLQMLMEHTGSQMAAAYLLSDDKKLYKHFESIGIDDDAKKAFSAVGHEGEFGAAVTTQRIQHLKNIPDTTRFLYNTVKGKFIPNEIITIPIVSGAEVIAIISLASVGVYEQISLDLIEKIHITYTTRIEGILAYRRIKEILARLEEQNHELETQQKELTAQSSEMAEQNRELEIQKNQLSEANKLKTSFLSNMSHELRTPLNSIIALSGVLSRKLAKQIPEEEHSYLEVIERNGKNLLTLINDILDISRIESGTEEIETTRFDLCPAINEVVGMIQPQAAEKNLYLKNAVGDCAMQIVTDGKKFRHILQNLIGNAVKFTGKGGVSISVKKISDKVAIIVTDTGIGISAEHLPHIFNEFRQADSGVSRRFGGTGLGLAIAKKYATLLGGTITVESIQGEGSEFTLTLPLIFSEKNQIIENDSGFNNLTERNRKPEISITPGGTKTIMLIEDSEPAVVQLKDILEENRYNAVVAQNGAEALELFNTVIPDAIILDLMMPGIDGFQVLKAIRNTEITAHIPVLILTAKYITKEDLQFLKRNNVYQLIQKGDIKRHELLQVVGEMTHGKTNG